MALETSEDADWSSNPFVDRMASMLGEESLRRRLTVEATPIQGLDDMPADAAGDYLGMRIVGQSYYPTDRSLELAGRILGTGYAHARVAYPDKATFIARSSAGSITVNPEPPTWLITGLAGIGKTSLLQALMDRMGLLPPMYQPSSHCLRRHILGGLFITVTSKAPKAEAVTKIADALGIEFGGTKVNERLLQTIRLELYRQGVLFILADEIQSQSGGASTGAVYVNFIGFLRSLGVPVIFVGNYSMCWVMLENHSQNRHRLLCDPFIALPDNHESLDYILRLRRYMDACGTILEIDPEVDGPQICAWTFGVNRHFVNLLIIAYKLARRTAKDNRAVVGMEQLKAAYESRSFGPFREEVGQLTNQLLLKSKPTRKDLICPFEEVGDAAKVLEESRRRLLDHALAAAKLKSGMTPADRKAIQRGTLPAPVVLVPDLGIVHEPESKAQPASPKAPAPKSTLPVQTPPTHRRSSRPAPSSADALRWGNAP